MHEEIFGQSSEPDLKRPPRLVVPQRCLNAIEVALIEQAGHAADLLPSLPSLPFIDGESGDIEGQDFEGMPLRTVLDLRNLLLLEAEKPWRRCIIIARELGPERDDGGPFTSEYEIACQAEGVNPWPGDPLCIEKKG
jgi:hypothetical protein